MKTISLVILFLAGCITPNFLVAQFQQQGPKLVGADAVGNAYQGSSVSISSDGNTAIVSGFGDNSNMGAVWVFIRNNGVWTQQGPKLVGTGAFGTAWQGWSVAISSNGNTFVEGGYSDSGMTGAVWVFTRTTGVWTQQGPKLVGTGAIGHSRQGSAVAISSDGNTIIEGGWPDNSYIGAVWVFTRNENVWTQQGPKLVGTGVIGSSQQGYAVSISSDGNTAIEGGFGDSNVGAVWVFTRSGGVWTQQGTKLVGTGAVGNAYQGSSVSISSDGNTFIEGGFFDNANSGAVWVFTRSGGVWVEQGPKLVGTGVVGTGGQGYSVSISSDGNTTIEGGTGDNYGVGAVWVFTRSGGVWTQLGPKLVGAGTVGMCNHGNSVSISSDGNTFIDGGYLDNSNAGAVWVFTATPRAPVLVLPANNSSGNLTSVALIWNRCLNAISYCVQLSADSLFNTLILDDSTLTDTAKSVTGLSNITNYWWRVNTKYVSGTSPFSSVFKFTTITAAPTAPNLILPSDNSSGIPVSLALVWSKTLTATSYRVQLSTDSLFNTLIVNDSTLTDSTRIVSGLSNLTNYWWRVNAKNAGGISSYSAVFKFTTIIAAPTAPVLVSPTNNAINVPTSLTLIWNKTLNAVSYRLQLASDSLFSMLVVNDSTLTDSTRIVSGLSNLTNYWWRVNAKNAGGISSYSTIFKFTTIIAAPTAPVLISPANNAINVPTSLTLIWNKTLNAVSYKFQLASDSLFSALIVNDSTLTDSTRSVSGLMNLTNYWWRVNAKNVGGVSSYSTVFKFTTVIAAPLAPVLISPANNSVGNLTALTLVWNKSANAVNYRVQLSTDSLFSALIVNDSILTDSIRVVSGLNPLTNYWWRVNAKNAGGSGAYSSVYKFKTLGVPAQLTGIFIPANGAIDQPLTVDFKWSRAFDQTLKKNINTPNKFNLETILNYWFELTTDSVSLASIIRDSTLTDTNKTQGGFNYATSYYWRVKAKNQIGWGSFSFWQKFTTAPPLPATVSLKVIPGGFFNPTTGTLRMRDTINVYLVDSATCLRVDSNRVVLDSVTFSASLSFSNAPTGNYYLYIYHRNHLPVASMYRQNIIRGSNVNYDLTTDSTKAYGFNMIEVSSSPDRWGMIPGDANRDEFVDGLDQTIWINQNGFDGYLLPDFNGDGFVDGLDQTLWIQNNGASSYLPCMTPLLDVSFEKLRRILERELYFQNRENNTNKNQK